MIYFFLLKTTFPPTPYNIYRKNFGKFAKTAKFFDFRRIFLFGRLKSAFDDPKIITKCLFAQYNFQNGIRRNV